MLLVDSVVTLVDLSGTPVRSLGVNPVWTVDYRTDSTNQLTVTVPVDEAVDVVSDMELLFNHRRFVISQVDRSRDDATVTVTADEAQAGLADVMVEEFKLEQATLKTAVAKLVENTLWSVGTLADETGKYYADLKQHKVSELLQWLANEAGLTLDFDSANRRVNMLTPEDTTPTKQFTYGVNMNDIQRSETPPTATVIHPIGANGLTVANLNNQSELVEDFGWYTSLGLTEDVARKRFYKKIEWNDDRYTVVSNLLRDAKKKLETLAYPSITYTLTAVDDIARLHLGEHVFVWDSLLNIRIEAKVSALRFTSSHSADEATLDYLPPSSAVSEQTLTGDTSDTNQTQLFQAFNDTDLTLTDSFMRVLPISIDIYADTMLQVNACIRVQATKAGLLEGYWLLNGEKAGMRISYSFSNDGEWLTLGLPFLITNVTAGNQTSFDLYLKLSGGGKILKNDCQVYIECKGAYGGIKNERPDRTVVDHIPSWLDSLNVPSDSVSVTFPSLNDHTLSEQVETWLESLTAPTDEVQPIVWLEDTTLVITNAPADTVYTVRFTNEVQTDMPATVDGTTMLDLSTVEGISSGLQNVLIVQLAVSVQVSL